MQNVGSLQQSTRGSNTIAAQLIELRIFVTWVCTWVSNDKLQSDILTGCAAQFLDLPVAGDGSVVAQFINMEMVNVWQSRSFIQLASCRGDCHHDSVQRLDNYLCV